jgi:hypothetical protein
MAIRRSTAPVIPANYSERRIIALENFILSTNLRGAAALAAFNEKQSEQERKGPPPLVASDPEGLKLQRFYSNIDKEIEAMRGSPDYWKWHEPRRG